MSYQSVDALQQALAKNVFNYAKDSKKAAGRALGTLVEIVTFYLLKAWGYEKNIAIERKVPEYANAAITHNVEFTLHPSKTIANLKLPQGSLPLSSKKIVKLLAPDIVSTDDIKPNQLLSAKKLLRNACTIAENEQALIVACLGDMVGTDWEVSTSQLRTHPFAMFECKRVGVEEGVKKGPQTIEKAKQGAYVARTVSSLQQIRMANGAVFGAMQGSDGSLIYKPYTQFLDEIIKSSDPALLRDFMLTVGVVSNHGNWFTSEDHNKELQVLAQAYDWLLFLSDGGLAQFVEDLLLSPSKRMEAVKTAFEKSYTGQRGVNKFTKVQIDLDADKALQAYYANNLRIVEGWFNVISPAETTIHQLTDELCLLDRKNWEAILK